MSMSSRDVVVRTIKFIGAPRIPYDLPEQYGSDFYRVCMDPSPDARYNSGVDEWGAVWHNLGVSKLGQVKDVPLKDWKDFDRLSIPNIEDKARWGVLEGIRDRAGDRFLLARGIALYERVHFIRGLENTWIDIYQEREKLENLIDILVEMNIYAIGKYSAAGADGFILFDDWGLQDKLMISPNAWREIWKPRYEKVFRASHDAGLLNFLHCCGHITAIMDDLIQVGLDVIQMDQQQNMGLERLGESFGGRICFWCPADIQGVMVNGTTDDIRAYCRQMVQTLGRPEGGFIAKWYEDYEGAGHSWEAIDAMSDEFLSISADKDLKYTF